MIGKAPQNSVDKTWGAVRAEELGEFNGLIDRNLNGSLAWPRKFPARDAQDIAIYRGDLLQAARDGKVESRMVFRFKDGSVFDETAVFTQQGVSTL